MASLPLYCKRAFTAVTFSRIRNSKGFGIEIVNCRGIDLQIEAIGPVFAGLKFWHLLGDHVDVNSHTLLSHCGVQLVFT